MRIAAPQEADGRVAVMTAMNEVVLEADLLDVATTLGENADKPAAVVLEIMDRVLAAGVVLREDETGAVVAHSVGLLNPFTNEIAVGALPRTLSFRYEGACPSLGITAVLEDQVLRIGNDVLETRTMSRRDLASAAAAHSM